MYDQYSYRSCTCPASILWLLFYLGCGPITLVGEEFVEPDRRRAELVGIRELNSQYLRIYTDLPKSPTVDELPIVFDKAVPLWAEYFGISDNRIQKWKMHAYVIRDRAKFSALGWLPQGRPDFVNGFANAQQLWMAEQPSDYYMRHLLLHEGTHGFMHAMLGGVGAGWYMEGMAELFGTHHWQEGNLHLRWFPEDRQQVPMWGRVKLIQEACHAEKALGLQAVLSIDKRRTFSTEEYAWCWALCKFLDAHPRWQKRFRQLPSHVADREFNEFFRESFQKDWSELRLEWQAYIRSLDYGYDIPRMVIRHRAGKPLEKTATIKIAADQGWQSTGWLLRGGKEYQIAATGQYTIAYDTKPWLCEPGGVTLQYHAGQPLGKLVGAWRGEGGNFSHPVPIGLQAVLKPEHDGVLYLRVNDSPARLSDNRGQLTARIALGRFPDD